MRAGPNMGSVLLVDLIADHVEGIEGVRPYFLHKDNPGVVHPCGCLDKFLPSQQCFRGTGHLEIAPDLVSCLRGLRHEKIAQLRLLVQLIVDGAMVDGLAQGRMLRDILDALAMYVYFPSVPKAFYVLLLRFSSFSPFFRGMGSPGRATWRGRHRP